MIGNLNIVEMGSDIDGACGQLRKRYMEKTESEK